MTQKQPKPLLFCYFGFEMQSQPQRARGVHLQARDVGALACLLPPVVCLHTHTFTHTHTHTRSVAGASHMLSQRLCFQPKQDRPWELGILQWPQREQSSCHSGRGL